jgi:AraC-like DNA-binding protein
MENKSRAVTQILHDTLIYSCAAERRRLAEQFVAEHLLAYQISGETHIYYHEGMIILKKDKVLLARKNQLTKSTKVPTAGEAYKLIAINLSIKVLRQVALEARIGKVEKYIGAYNLFLTPDALIKGYFQSLLPYIEANMITQKLAALKTREAIELLLHLNPALTTFLFDFSEPHKIDLEKFMLQNFHFNAPLADLAKLTGRSLAGFKRDFLKTFGTSPRKWLQEKRLTEAHYLIKEKRKKSADIYLDLGFKNLSHFYTSFKQKFGFTPTGI